MLEKLTSLLHNVRAENKAQIHSKEITWPLVQFLVLVSEIKRKTINTQD